jgi:uncharacterized membrane protein
MTLQHWLTPALVNLEAQARTRLEAEYTAHLRDALTATGDEAQALAQLGNPSELNRQLQRSYLMVEEAGWIDRYVAELSRPAWAYGLVCAVVVLTAVQGAGWAGMWGMWLVTALALSVRALAPRFTSPRRASLLVVAVVIPLQLVGLTGPLPQTLAQLLTGLINAVLFLIVTGLVFILPRLQVWRKVLWHG